MNVGFINTGLKRINTRVLSDGVFFISPKTLSKNVLGVIEQSFNDYASLINESLTKNANQCFFIKYNDDEDFYTIMPLHSHQFIGVEPKEDGNYNFSLICQTAKDDNYLIQWKINTCDDSYFNIQLKDTDFLFEFQKDLNIPVLNKKSDTDNQKFSFKNAPTIKSGIYKINLKFDPKSFVSLPKNSKDATFEEENKKNYNDQIFSVTYDSVDGCYSIVNLESMNCLSSFNGSKEKSFVSQNDFFGVDFQRWIIGTYQSKNSDYFIELKSNLLRLGAGEKINFQFIPIVLEKFDKNQPLKNKQIFNFKPSKYMNFNESKKYQGFVEEGTKFRYKKEFNLPMELQYDKWVVFENCHFLTKFQLPISVQRIPKNAFLDLKRIKIIDCDPKWIKLFPNPLNIENVIVPQGVEVIEEDSFKELQNLKVLSLPASLKIENFDPNVFKDFYDLRRFEGNPLFFKIYS